MTAKEEFYGLIASTFTEEEISTVKDIIKELKEDVCDYHCESSPSKEECSINIDALYYDLCGLFYSSCKDFNNFKSNLTKRCLPFDYTKFIRKEEKKKETTAIECYDETHNKIKTFVQNSELFNNVKDKDSISNALTNALVPELLEQKDREERLNYYEGCQKLKELSYHINEGKHITRISFDLDNQHAGTIDRESIINEFWDDIINFAAYRIKLPENLDFEIEKLKKDDDSIKRIALRICMVLVNYDILSTTTSSDRYFLTNKNGEYISLNQNIMHNVFLLLIELGQKFKEREGEVLWVNGMPTEHSAGKVRNLLRNNKNGINENFSYDNISDLYYGYFIKGTSNKKVMGINTKDESKK